MSAAQDLKVKGDAGFEVGVRCISNYKCVQGQIDQFPPMKLNIHIIKPRSSAPISTRNVLGHSDH